MPSATDRQVLERAIEENRIILRNVNGIFYFRFAPTSPDEAGVILSSILQEQDITLAGMFTVIERDRIRQRALSAIKD